MSIDKYAREGIIVAASPPRLGRFDLAAPLMLDKAGTGLIFGSTGLRD
ncbi:MAG: hypothetical protein LBT86_07085 [Deltaproteobacteria bacterium]|jgi:hypothetical protein|nr:hypothetical protein [Deltaproteobacteria bacterium]